MPWFQFKGRIFHKRHLFTHFISTKDIYLLTWNLSISHFTPHRKNDWNSLNIQNLSLVSLGGKKGYTYLFYDMPLRQESTLNISLAT